MGDLADAAGLGIMTLNRFEAGETIRAGSQAKIADALTGAGILFIAPGDAPAIGGEGVRLRD